MTSYNFFLIFFLPSFLPFLLPSSPSFILPSFPPSIFHLFLPIIFIEQAMRDIIITNKRLAPILKKFTFWLGLKLHSWNFLIFKITFIKNCKIILSLIGTWTLSLGRDLIRKLFSWESEVGIVIGQIIRIQKPKTRGKRLLAKGLRQSYWYEIQIKH